jgi:stage V sporulation protein AD
MIVKITDFASGDVNFVEYSVSELSHEQLNFLNDNLDEETIIADDRLLIKAYFDDLAAAPEDFDLIVTGDLGQIGKEALMELSLLEGVSLGGKLTDCGTLIYDLISQDVHAGGSGCGCSAVTLCGYYLDQLNKGKLKRILFCGTGALLSPTSTQQGLPIPGVCHAVCIHGREA